MKRTIWVLILMTFSNLFSQNCEYSKNEKDEFTGDSIKMTKYTNIYEEIDLDYYRNKYLDFKEPEKIKKKEKQILLQQKSKIFLEFVDKKFESKIGVFKISAIKLNNTYFIKFYISRKDIFSIDKGSDLMLKLENDKIIKLHNSELKIATHKKSGDYTIWYEVYDFIINNDQFNDLINSPLKKVRIYLDKGYSEKEIIDKYKENLIKVLKCVE